MSRPFGETPRPGFDKTPVPNDLTLANMLPAERFTELEAFLGGQEFVAQHLVMAADHFIYEAGRYDRSIDKTNAHAESLDTTAWERCIDPRQPTLGIRAGRVSSASLLAVAAQRLRQQGERICNVVLLPELAFAREVYTTEYFAERGILLDNKGAAYAGNFPDSLRIDAFPAQGNEGLWDKAAVGRYINSPGTERLFDDKTKVQERLASTDVPHAIALLANVTANDPRLYHALLSVIHDRKAVVVKPTAESTGRGVIMVDPEVDTIDDVFTRLRAQGQANPEARYMLEEWVRSYPLRHRKTGISLDWNVRAYMVGGENIGAYARVGSLGEAINVSRGAERENLEDVFDDCGLSAAARQSIYSKLETFYAKIVNVFPEAGIMGLDIIINRNLEPILLEVNGERSGGLESLISVSTSPRLDHSPVYNAIRSLHKRLFSHVLPPRQPIHDPKSQTRQEDIINALEYIDIAQDPERALQLAQALPLISESLPVPLQEKAWNYRKAFLCIAEAERPTVQDIQSSLTTASLEIRRRIMYGELDAAYAPINMWVHTDPTNMLKQHRGAEAFAETSKIDFEKILEATYGISAQSSENAEAMGRGLFFSLLARTGSEVNALSHSTITSFIKATADFYAQPPETRRFPKVETLGISPGEAKYLKSVINHMESFGALARGDYTALYSLIEKHIHADGDIDDTLLNSLDNHFRTNDTKSTPGRYAHFLVSLAFGAVPDAYALLKELPLDLRQQESKRVHSLCETSITAAGVPLGSSEHHAILQALLKALETATSERPEKAYADIQALDKLIMSYGRTRLGTIREMILDYTDEATGI